MTQAIAGQIESALLRPLVPDAPGPALLSWRLSAPTAAALQVYLDGRLHDVIADADQRETWLHLDRSRPVRIELLAVDRAAMWVDHGDGLDGWDPPFVTTAAVALVRDESLPVDARVIVSVDGVDDPPARLWGPRDARNGFGGVHGIGSFGLDDATGPGHGLGEFGVGPMGSDGFAWRWRRDDLDPGEHAVSVRIETADGRVIGTIDAPPVTIDALPTPAQELNLDDTYALTWA